MLAAQAWDASYLPVALAMSAGVAATALVGRSNIRPGPYPEVSSFPAPEAPTADLAEERYRRHCDWLLQKRWLVLMAAGALTLAGRFLVGLLEPWRAMLLGDTLVVLAGVNWTVGRLLQGRSMARPLIRVQLAVDLAALTFMLHLTGGLENPLAVLFVFLILLAGMFLGRLDCIATALAALSMYTAMGLLELSGRLPHYAMALFLDAGLQRVPRSLEPDFVIARLAAEAIVFLSTAYLTGLVVGQLRETEQRLFEASERAKGERYKFDLVVESAGAGLLLLGPTMRVQWFNRYAREWLQLDSSSLGEPLPPVDGEPPAGGLESIPGIMERIVNDVSGHQRILTVTTTPVVDRDGHVTQIVQLLHDVTAQRQARSQLLHATKLATVGQLAGNIAHEVNNPVAIIAAKVRLLLSDFKDTLPARVTSELQKVVEQANRLGAMTHRLLTACRPSPGSRGDVALEDVMTRVLDLVDQRAAQAHVAIRQHRDCTGAHVFGNADELQQIVLNLVTNALDSMPSGGTLTVDLGCGPPLGGSAPLSVVLRVRDTGAGMPPQERARIFEPFFTTKEQGRGTGLGLAISLGIAQEHGGTIDVDSVPGDGSCFTLRLPALLPLACGYTKALMTPAPPENSPSEGSS